MKYQRGQLTSSQYSSNALLCCLVVVSVFTGSYLYESIALHNAPGVQKGTKIARIVSCAIRVLGTVFMFLVWMYKRNFEQATVGKRTGVMISLLPMFTETYHVLLTISLCVRVVTEVLVGQCDGPIWATANATSCNYFQDTNSIQPSYLITLMAVPLLAYIMIRETSVLSIALSWIMSIVTLTWCAVYMHSRLLGVAIALSVFTQVLIYYDAKRQNDDMICMVAALRAAAEENERLQEEARATELRAMIGNVAHDLKTVSEEWCLPLGVSHNYFFPILLQPLTSLLTGIEVIQDTMQKMHDVCEAHRKPGDTRDPCEKLQTHVSSVRACLKSMIGSNSFMTMCINRCLDYTKASKGVKLVPKPETVNLQEALDYPISIMRDVQTQLPITLAAVPGEICSHIITDKQWLMENVLCLLSNAVRYSLAGSVTVCTYLKHIVQESSSKTPARGVFLHIEVCDCGIGLSEELMTTLFAPFKQAQRLAGGTGLGLFSLAKRVEALRGEYGVCKRPDGCQGSMFWFSIPYRPDDFSAASAAVSRHESANLTTEASFDCSVGASFSAPLHSSSTCDVSLCVLVVDDAPSILKMTAMLLTKKGYMVDKAVNGAEALGLVVDRLGDSSLARYDVVLMDLQMPVMDGPTAIRRIREAERKAADEGPERAGDVESGGGKAWQYQARPHRQLIIALSANSDSDTMQEALDAGADHFMSKPFTYETFRELVTRQGTF